MRLTLPAQSARLLTAQELEAGADGVTGQFGAGSGKWQLFVTSDEPISGHEPLAEPHREPHEPLALIVPHSPFGQQIRTAR